MTDLFADQLGDLAQRYRGRLSSRQASIAIGELVIRAVGKLVVGELVLVIVIASDSAGPASFCHADQLPATACRWPCPAKCGGRRRGPYTE